MRMESVPAFRAGASQVEPMAPRGVLRSSPKREVPASWVSRWLKAARTPTTYHRCLAVHMYYAEPRSSLS